MTPEETRRYIDKAPGWRAVWYGRYKHFFISVSVPAVLQSRGRTLCGRYLSEYERGDIKNNLPRKRCPKCEKLLSELEAMAQTQEDR